MKNKDLIFQEQVKNEKKNWEPSNMKHLNLNWEHPENV